MGTSFLFSFGSLNSCFFEKRDEDSSVLSKETYDKIFTLCKENRNCFVYGSAQTLDKIKGGFSAEAKARFEDTINRESTTLGLSGFNPDSSETLNESTKSLSFGGYVIVICTETEKAQIKINTRSIAVTPAEFLSSYSDSLSLLDKLQKILTMTKTKLTIMDILMAALFKKDSYNSLKTNIDGIPEE